MILYIDASLEPVEISILGAKPKISQKLPVQPQAEEFGEAIRVFLDAHKILFNQITKIVIRTVPGFFSRVRSVVVAANALAFALGTNIVSLNANDDINVAYENSGQQMVQPNYGGEPNISKPKQ